MATSTSIGGKQPRLEAVFGSLTAAEDSEIRTIFGEIDAKLLSQARRFGRGRAGWEGTGLELTWLPSSQVEISSFVETCLDGDRCVSFCVELRPGWFYDEKSGEAAWDVAADIYVDCQHEVDHKSMHLVYAVPATCVTSPMDAAVALRAAVEELARLGEETPIERRLQLASDEDGFGQRP